MYISKLSIQGYKNTQKKSTISFNKGLNVLLGENGCGKTAVINALEIFTLMRCRNDKSAVLSITSTAGYIVKLVIGKLAMFSCGRT